MNKNEQTVLVTGANSGIGLETVKKLSELGYHKIILGCRTIEKGEKTIRHLLTEGFVNSVYEVLVIDVASKSSSFKGLRELVAKNCIVSAKSELLKG
ncbi:SDR family NAD(P)-dependent oxidoreductase [Muriicola sp. Z0-33]|uniref:SDR family NAD(P)-dependent oxidoreductase n=1 Tax=Muriicola sp. Z0-33 TaxID=2816957 RepID=UPI002238F760|nr:SDR family NAD(P)-dependent oxidoreductase [Muriicola sp. Z0-33]MCW5516931.1 SDR family NAD(P)-dependent oxidoreductase [Muriicola sp. Z0-33]